jgi:hypothetical protein
MEREPCPFDRIHNRRSLLPGSGVVNDNERACTQPRLKDLELAEFVKHSGYGFEHDENVPCGALRSCSSSRGCPCHKHVVDSRKLDCEILNP